MLNRQRQWHSYLVRQASFQDLQRDRQELGGDWKRLMQTSLTERRRRSSCPTGRDKSACGQNFEGISRTWSTVLRSGKRWTKFFFCNECDGLMTCPCGNPCILCSRHKRSLIPCFSIISSFFSAQQSSQEMGMKI